MFDVVKEYIKHFFASRLLPVAVFFVLLFVILVNRMFQLQISEADEYSNQSGTKSENTRDIKASRGKIYDCNGKLLAYNKLTYNVTYERTESTADLDSQDRNEMIYQLLQILEEEDEELSVEFYIEFDKNGDPQFTVSGNTLLRFKAEVYSTKLAKLTQEQRDATAQEIYDFLRYDMTTKSPRFDIGDQYDDETALKIMAVRYTMYINRNNTSQKLTLASDVSDKTVAAIKENSTELPGIDIDEDTIRVYKKSKYFAHILGYTGSVTSDKLEELKEEDPNTDYTMFDQIGISGLESTYEEYLRGQKGTEKITTDDSTGRVEEVTVEEEPVAGNDLYLSIDATLQEECYKLLEEHIAGILIANINNSDSAGTKGTSASDIKVPIYDVYSALIENNVINSERFTDDDASKLEKSTYKKYRKKSKKIKNSLKSILAVDSKKTESQLSDSMAEFVDYFYEVLKDNDVVLVSDVDESDATFKKFSSDKISLSEFLQYAITQNWIDLSVLDIGESYFSTEEIYQKLLDYGMELLDSDTTYPKMIYSYLIHQHELSGKDVCLLLFDQGDIEYNAEEYQKLELGLMSPYNFIIKKIKNLEITPGELGLEPCSGSLVVTDVNTGQVKAMVSYPSYDNNKMANQVDSDYFYTYLTQASSSPLLNRPTQQELAPGSTFKVVSSVAALEEGILTPSTTIYDHVKFDKINPSPSCWKKTGHGSLHVSTALEASCNYFYYNVGYELGGGSSGSLSDSKGLSRLKKYADMFGLTDKSGVEITESEPQFSTTDVVRSAIGQATHAYTPSQLSRYVTTIANNGTCYDLTLISKIKDVSGKTILNNKANVRNQVDIADSTWNAIQHGMYLVVNGSGASSSVRQMFSGLNVTVAGKTGTAQLNEYHANHALFISYAPYDNPEISVTCVIPNGYASSNAAQTARDVYKYYFSKKKKKVSGNVKMPESTVNSMD
ncbi:MAG: peptidase [Clostridiaceae bacterium]|nr:peptidase [Clostridiaceae bacterium]